MKQWRDRNRWANASVLPPLLMIATGVLIWPVGIPGIAVGSYLIWIIGKAQKEKVDHARDYMSMFSDTHVGDD